MSTKMGRVIYVAVAVVAIALAFSGCGQKAQEAEQVQMAPSEGPATGKAPPEGAEPAEGPQVAEKPESLGDVIGGFELPTSFEMQVEMPEGMMPSGVGETKMMMKLEDRRPVKMKVEHEAAVMLLDYGAEKMYTYQPGLKQGVEIPLKTSEAQKKAPVNPYEHYEPGHEVTGSEVVDGVDCWVIEASDSGKATKLWIGKEDGLARQVKVDEGVMKIKYSRINEVPDSEFELPDDVTIRQMPSMPDMSDIPDVSKMR